MHIRQPIVPVLAILALLPVGFATPEDEEKVSANLKLPDGVSQEVLELFQEAKETFDGFMKERDEGEHRLGDMERAISQFHKVRRKKKDLHLVYYYLGIAHQMTREFKKAEKFLKKAMELRESFNEAMAELGDVYFWQSNWKKAKEWFDRAIETDPEYVYAYQRRAYVYIRLREYEKSKEDVKKWAKLDPKSKKVTDEYLKTLDKETEEGAFDGFFKTESEHYILITNESQAVADEMSEQAELIFRVYTASFGKLDKGADKFPIIYFKNREDYLAYGAPPPTLGYYSGFVRKLVLFNSGSKEQNYTTLYHEGFHQFVHYYLASTPQWFNEGNADFFGACRRIPGKKEFEIRPNTSRLPHIQRILRSGSGYHATPEALMTMSQREMYDRANIGRNYAQAWSLIYFLRQYQDGKYRPLLKKYWKALREGKWLKEAYEDAFGGVDMEQLEEQWKGYILGLGGR